MSTGFPGREQDARAEGADLAPMAAPGPIRRNQTLATCLCTRATTLGRSDKDLEGIIDFYSCKEIGLCRAIIVRQIVEPLIISDIGIWFKGEQCSWHQVKYRQGLRDSKEGISGNLSLAYEYLLAGGEVGLSLSFLLSCVFGVRALCQEKSRLGG